MSDSDKELKIKITSAADMTGAAQAAQSLDLVSKKTNEAAREAQTNAKRAEFLGLKFGELKRLASEMAREFPLAGEAARLMLNPIEGTAVAGITAFVFMQQAIDEMNKALDEASERAANPIFIDGINAWKDAIAKLNQEAADFDYHMTHLRSNVDDFNSAINTEIDLLKQAAAAMKALADAQKSYDDAQTAHKVATGQLTQTGEVEQKAAAEIAARNKATEEAEKAHAAEIATKQGEQEKLDEALPSLQAAYEAAKQKNDSFQADKDKTKADLENYKSQEEEARKTQKEAADALFAHEHNFADRINPFRWQDLAAEKKQLEEKEREAQSALDAAATLRKKAQDKDRETTTAADEFKTTQSELEKAKAMIGDLAVAIKNLTDSYRAADQTARATTATQNETTATKAITDIDRMSIGGGYTGADAERAAQLERARKLNQQLTPDDSAWLKAFEDWQNQQTQHTKLRFEAIQRAIAQHQFVSDADTEFYKSYASLMDKNGRLVHSMLDLNLILAGAMTKAQAKLDALEKIVFQLQGRSNTPPPRQ